MTTDNERDIANASTAIDNLDLSYRQMIGVVKAIDQAGLMHAREIAALKRDRDAMTIRLEALENHIGIRNIGKKNAD
jgi:hypothetical protein